jgi:hypothetical protein
MICISKEVKIVATVEYDRKNLLSPLMPVVLSVDFLSPFDLLPVALSQHFISPLRPYECPPTQNQARPH